MNRSATVRPFGIRDKVGYLFGDFGNDFTFIFSTMMLMKFYTDVMGVSAGVVGLVMTIARIVDAFTDVTMGRICDRSRTTAHGKFKPWLLRMCGPVAIASFLIYQSGLAGLPMGGQDRLPVRDLHPVGIGLLHGHQHSLRLHGFRHLGGPR